MNPASPPADAVETESNDAAAFIRRGLASREEARRSGKYVSADAVLRKLDAKLRRARAAKAEQAPRV